MMINKLDKVKKILHCPHPIGGNPQGISSAEKSLGYISHTMSASRNRFGYPCDIILLKKSRWSELILPIKKLYWAMLIPFRYDEVHYSFGASLAPSRVPINDGDTGVHKWKKKLWNVITAPFEFWDVKWAKVWGCKVTVTYQGSDARQGDYCRTHFKHTFAHHVGADYFSRHKDQLKKKWIRKFFELADQVYTVNPDLCWVLPSGTKFIGYASVNPVDFPMIGQGNGTIKVLHAPSHRGIKGTEAILSALEEIKSEGVEFELLLVENLPHQVAKDIYKQADIIIEQIYAGWYGALALELMAMGKVAAAYIREEDLVHIPEKMREDLPIININPETLKKDIKNLITMDLKKRQELAVASRKYAEKWHDPIEIARTIHCDN